MASSLEADREDKARFARLFESLVRQVGKTRRSCVEKCKRWGRSKNRLCLDIVLVDEDGKKSRGRLLSQWQDGCLYGMPFEKDASWKEIAKKVERASLLGYNACLMPIGSTSIDSMDLYAVWLRRCVLDEMSIELGLGEK